MIVTVENENGDLLVSREYLPSTCDHGHPLITLDDCRYCRQEEMRQIWLERSEVA